MRISDWSSDVCSSDLLSESIDQHVQQPGISIGRNVAIGAMRRHEILNGICQPRLIGRQSENRSYHFVHHGPARAFKMIEIRTLLRLEPENAVIKNGIDDFPCLHYRFTVSRPGFD